MKTETRKRIAELVEPNRSWHLGEGNSIWTTSNVPQGTKGITFLHFDPRTNPEQELKLIRMYREWLLKRNLDFADINYMFIDACESSETLLEAIARDVLGDKP